MLFKLKAFVVGAIASRLFIEVVKIVFLLTATLWFWRHM